MKQEDKDLLFKELSARYPYGVKILEGGVIIETLQKIEKVSETLYIVNGYDESIGGGFDISQVKLYLRPMSSMTEEEEREFEETLQYTQYTLESYDWLNAHHFDYRGLIPMGLALEAPEGMYTHFGDMKTVVSEITHKDRF